MKAILLPIDVAKSPPEVFEVVKRFGRKSPVTVILLHVVTLNLMASENRVYEELCQEAQLYLERMAREYLPLAFPSQVRVRLGKPAEEILTQAKSDHPDLILLPVYRRSTWKKMAPRWSSRSGATVSAVAQAVIREASCDVLVVPMTAYFNCERKWGRPSIQPAATPSGA